MTEPLGTSVGGAHRNEVERDGTSAGDGIDRRRFVKGAAAGIGIAAVGVVVKGQAAAEPAAAAGSGLDGRLRAITWTGSNSAVGLLSVGADEVKVRPMTLKDQQLRFSGNEIATLAVGPGPVAIGAVPGSTGSVMVARTTLETIGQYPVSFDLDSDLRRFLLDEGLGFDGYKTAGQTTYDIQQAVPAPILLGSNGEVESSVDQGALWKRVLTDAHYQPLSVHNLNDKWIAFLASSGSNNVDISILGDVIGIELSAADASILAVHPIGKVSGYSNKGFEVVELSKTRVAILSVGDSDKMQVTSYDFATKEAKNSSFSASDLPNSRRILQHDRLTASGRPRSWIAEVVPGTYTLETMGSEVL